jgi:hypothetical protein
VAECNDLFGESYSPLEGFSQFSVDEVPSNSDVTFVLAQYIAAAEKFRSDHVYVSVGRWYYRLDDGEPLPAAPPSRLGQKR